MRCRRCAACGARFRPRPQVPQQRFCSQAACQRERRRRWKRVKHRSDPDYRTDYRDNQARAQRAWRERHAGYWREYRRGHPEYRERNRQRQRIRNGRRGARGAADMIAKRNASEAFDAEISGTYLLTPVVR